MYNTPSKWGEILHQIRIRNKLEHVLLVIPLEYLGRLDWIENWIKFLQIYNTE